MEGGRLIALHEAKYFAVKDGLLSIGPGAFVKGLEYSSGTKATIIGKPSASFFQCALDDM
jgi:ribonucleotide monophosphatase NagD (HAD superfamily)